MLQGDLAFVRFQECNYCKHNSYGGSIAIACMVYRMPKDMENKESHAQGQNCLQEVAVIKEATHTEVVMVWDKRKEHLWEIH